MPFYFSDAVQLLLCLLVVVEPSLEGPSISVVLGITTANTQRQSPPQRLIGWLE